MSHTLSLACYRNAQRDATIDPRRYADLAHLLGMLGLLDDEQQGVQQIETPDRFDYLPRMPTLLIVEDDPDVTALMMEMLVGAGYPRDAIHDYRSGEEAIVYARKHAVSIAFLDIRLANPMAIRKIYASGLQVLKAIKEASPGSKVFLVSGFGTYEMARKAILDLGASYYLGKPFARQDLLALVHWAIERLIGTEVKHVITAVPPGLPTEVRECILVVDDDLSVAEAIASSLGSVGYRAQTAGGGAEALRKLASHPFDAVLLDIRMPEVDGIEVLKRIVQRDREQVVLMLTAVEDERIAEETIKLGATDFLTKPCDLNLLQFALEHAFLYRQTQG